VSEDDTQEEIVARNRGKIIAQMELVDNELIIGFVDGTALNVWDGGQSCCENRYMSSDDLDNSKHYTNVAFVGIEVRDMGDADCEYGDHQQQALIVRTFLGDLTFVNHNEHNGYYGGFSVQIAEGKWVP
jgi:hypothetical protein